MADPIKFIFIATADDGAFEDAATARTKELCKQFYDLRRTIVSILPAPAVLRFIHFNCLRDTIRVFDFPLTTKATPKPPTNIGWRDLNSFVATGDVRFSPKTFLDTNAPLSILNLYHSIRGAPPQSVLELSIYSHAWAEGPVLRSHPSSSDSNPPQPINNLPIRNSADTDGRTRTDFEDNMGEDPTVGAAPNVFPRTGGKDAFSEFKTAFDKNALFFIGGCDSQDPIRDVPNKNALRAVIRSSAAAVINQAYIIPTKKNEAEKSNKIKSDAAKRGAIIAGGNIDATFDVPIDIEFQLKDERRDIDSVIKEWKTDHPGRDVQQALDNGDIRVHYTVFNLNDKAADLETRRAFLYSLDRTFVTPFFPAINSTEMQFTRKWSRVVGFVARRLQPIYAVKAATKLGIRVIAAPVGLGSIVLDDKQMHVCGVKQESPCWRILAFYQKFMGVSMDSRYYLVFDQTAIDHINDLAKQ